MSRNAAFASGSPLLHFHLVTAQIMFSMPAGQDDAGNPVEQVSAIIVNGVIHEEEKTLNAHRIGKAQIVAQMQFNKKLGGDPSVAIKDVVLLNLSYLGHMTMEQFHEAPAGTALQEVAAQTQADGLPN